MKISTLISGSLALVMAATSLTPALAAPISPANDGVRSAVEHVQYRQRTEEEEQLRRQRRENRQRRDGNQPRQEQRGELGRPPGDPVPRYRAEIVRPEPREYRQERRGERYEQRGDRREARREHRFERRGNQAYFNGHRGYRDQRRGYRYYEGYWFPPAAFLLGAIIAGQQPRYRNADWEDHVDWCYDRYGNRYRERDNTYISRSGYRRECISPFS